jgi:hypothetical protein
MSYLLGEYTDNIIRVDRRYRSILSHHIMIVTTVTDTEVQFSRKGVSGIFMMPVEKFCEIVLPDPK